MLLGSLVPLVFFAFFVGIIVLTVYSGVRRQRKAREQLAGLASRMGLELKRQPAVLGFEGPATVEGQHRDRMVRFFTFTTGSGKSRVSWSATSAAVAGTGGFTLDLGPESLFTRIATKLGMQDIQIGDPEFDRQFVVKSNDAAYASAALLPEIRARLLAERSNGAHGHLAVKGGEVRYAEVGGFDDPARTARLAGMLEVACDLAEVAEVYKA